MALTKPAGTWTYEDLLELPNDGRRYEIIEGDLYEVSGPSWEHIVVVMNLVLLLGPVIRSLGGEIAAAPADVFFSGADPVQPNVLAILPGSRATGGGRGVQGPPDLVIEVLSPSNRRRDTVTKRALYGRGGVREYWIVDPEARSVEVFALKEDTLQHIQRASEEEAVVSPLLGYAEFSLDEIFARIGQQGSV